jgi:hypothetical protein
VHGSASIRTWRAGIEHLREPDGPPRRLRRSRRSGRGSMRCPAPVTAGRRWMGGETSRALRVRSGRAEGRSGEVSRRSERPVAQEQEECGDVHRPS